MFVPHNRVVTDVEPFEMVASSATLALGVAMTSAGALCTGTNAPAYICMGKAVTVGDETKYPAIRVTELTEFACPGTASIAAGTAVTIAATGDGVTTTTTSGVFHVTKNLGNGTVIGHF